MKNRYFMMVKHEGSKDKKVRSLLDKALARVYYIVDTKVKKIAFSCKTEIEARNLMDMLNEEEQYEDSFSIALEKMANDKKAK